MSVTVTFYSYYKNLAGCALTGESVPEGTTLEALFQRMAQRYPQLAPLRKSTLMAVGVDYQPGSYVVKEGDEISFFPPVQGG